MNQLHIDQVMFAAQRALKRATDRYVLVSVDRSGSVKIRGQWIPVDREHAIRGFIAELNRGRSVPSLILFDRASSTVSVVFRHIC